MVIMFIQVLAFILASIVVDVSTVSVGSKVQLNSTTGNLQFFDLNDLDQREKLIRDGITLRIGDKVALMLEENPSTGYSWQIDDQSTLGLFTISAEHHQSTTYDQAGIRERRVGAPGQKVFTLTGSKPGEAKFRAVYARLWEWDEKFTD